MIAWNNDCLCFYSVYKIVTFYSTIGDIYEFQGVNDWAFLKQRENCDVFKVLEKMQCVAASSVFKVREFGVKGFNIEISFLLLYELFRLNHPFRNKYTTP